MAAGLEGKLVNVRGCLRVKAKEDSDGYLLIWPHDVSLKEEVGGVHILDSEGKVVARVGQKVSIGGGSPPAGYEAPTKCPGPYWLVGEINGAR